MSDTDQSWKKDFDLGALVRLRSGGPPMTVVEVPSDPKTLSPEAAKYWSNRYGVAYFGMVVGPELPVFMLKEDERRPSGLPFIRREYFPAEALILISPGNKKDAASEAP